jgi:hypothetical protein
MLCALLMARFALAPGGIGWAVAPRGYGNAATVARDSGWLNPDVSAAPISAWHFWDWGTDWHVGVDLSGGGVDVFMASSFLRESWGSHIGVNSVVGYNAANQSARYLGWAANYRGGRYNLPAGTASNGENPLAYDAPPPRRDFMNGSSIRIQDGEQSAGAIFYQETPRGPYYPLDTLEWGAMSSSGLGFGNGTFDQVVGKLRAFGLVGIGRIIRDQGSGAIYRQAQPSAPYVQLTYDQWVPLAAAGVVYENLTSEQVAVALAAPLSPTPIDALEGASDSDSAGANAAQIAAELLPAIVAAQPTGYTATLTPTK